MNINNNRGVAIIYITLFLLILGIVFVAWAIDVGWMVFVRSQSQAAVDAAALRGAAAIPNYNNNTCDMTLVTKMAAGLDTGNTVSGLSATESSVQVCSGGDTNPTCPAACSPETPGTSVRVGRTYSTPLFFSRLINAGNSTNITVSATAYLGGLAAGAPDLPGAISTCALQLPLSCQLQQVTTNILDLVSSVQNLAGSALLPLLPDAKACNMPTGAIPRVEVGQTIGRVPGNCFYKNVKERYCEAMTGKTDCDGDEGTWCYATIPVVDCDNIVTGFTTMCIRKVQDATESTKRVMEAVFCCSHTEPGPTILGPTGAEFYGTYADRPILVR